MRAPDALPRLSSRLLLLLSLCCVHAAADASVGLSNPDGYWAVPAPPLQQDHVAVYVPGRDLLVLVATDPADPLASVVWTLPLTDGDAWIQLAKNGPAIGAGAVAVYDPVGDRILIQGGTVSTGVTWSLRLDPGDPGVEWSPLVSAAEGPGPRWEHTAVYDNRHRRVLLFGGLDAAGPHGDVWELRLGGARPRWSLVRMRASGPGARAGHAAIYDAVGDRMLVVGGAPTAGPGEVWELSLQGSQAWRRLMVAGGPGASRTGHTAVLDPADHSVLVYGGSEPGMQNDVWKLVLGDSPGWSLLTPAGRVAPARSGHVAVFDPVQGRMLVSGGMAPRNETWAFASAGAGRWDRLAPAPELPPAGYGEILSVRAAFDTRRDRLFVVAGHLNDDPIAQTWVLTFAPDPHWSRWVDAPTRDQDFVYDAARDRLVLHGGFMPTGRSNVTWELPFAESAPRWTPLTLEGFFIPPARMNHVVVLDSGKDRLVVFGGLAGTSGCAVSVDSYLLALDPAFTAWSEVVSTAFPEGGWSPVGVYDEETHRAIVHGGDFACRFPGGYPGGFTADGTWALDLAGASPQWARLVAPAQSPGKFADAAYDPIGHRMLAIRPMSLSGFDSWALPLDAGAQSWRQMAPGGDAEIATSGSNPRPASLDYDIARDRFVLVTAAGPVGYLLRSRTAPAAVIADAPVGDPDPVERDHSVVDPDGPAPATTPLALALRSNPVRERVVLAVAVPQGPAASVELHDLRGRLLVTRSIPGGTSGEVTLPVERLGAGVYFVRLRRGTDTLVRKFVVAP